MLSWAGIVSGGMPDYAGDFPTKLQAPRQEAALNEMLTNLQCRILKRISPGGPESCRVYDGKSKLAVLMGDGFFKRIQGKVVIDFGCGEGSQSLEMAGKGASQVIGIDIREEALQIARQKARGTDVLFATSTKELADVIISVDAFEHFDDPAAILRIMNGLLKPTGEVLINFGPTWYHPGGGHVFSIFPWSHLIFSEKALIRWRATFKTDGATRFSEVSGGLNQMTIGRFEKIVADSPFQFSSLELIPIRKLRRYQNRLTREFTTTRVLCSLVKRT